MKTFKEITGDVRSSMHSRSFKVGGYSVATCVVVLAMAILLNILAGAIPASVTQFDTTSNELFTISDQTKTVLKGLEDEVTIYWVVPDGDEDATLQKLLERYESLSSKINVVKKDPDVYPNFAAQYYDGSVYSNSLVVACGDVSRYVDYNDIYEYSNIDYYSYTYDVSFAGEGCLTSAISYVTDSNLPVVYTLTGHGELSLCDSFQSAVEKENISLEELSLITENAVPEDAQAVLIYSPSGDVSENEAAILNSYLETGGKLIMVTDLLDGVALTNLESLVSPYGVSSCEGVVIEGDSNHYAWQTPYYLLPNIESSTITDPLIDNGNYILLPIAQGLKVGETPENVTVTELLTTSDSAFSKVAGYAIETYEKEEGDLEGPFTLGVQIEDSDSGAEIVWVSSGALLDESTDSQVSGANLDMFLNTLDYMCEKTDSITIHAKSMSYEYLTMESSTVSLLTVLAVGIVPLTFLAAGIVIVVRRKRV